MSNYYLNELNGHYYTYVTDSGISWDEASSGAQSMSYGGSSGYLATITTESEMQFIDSVVFGSGRPDNTFVGGSDAYQEGVWRWVTGPEGLESDGAGRVFFESGAYVGEKAADWINYSAGDTESNDYLYIYSYREPQFNPWNGVLGSRVLVVTRATWWSSVGSLWISRGRSMSMVSPLPVRRSVCRRSSVRR